MSSPAFGANPIPIAARLTFNKLVRVAWFFVWRLFLMDLAFNKYTGAALSIALGRFVSLPIIAALIVGYLYLLKWFVALMLRKRFGNFRIQLIRDDDQPNDEVSFKETLRIWWLLYWRSMILNGVVGFMFPGKSHTFLEALWNPQ